ncbi:MAG: metal-dependent hydrolase [Chloroflexi bacterium]|nr:metal-dependent hydrolase [Chloroflexota bacterium]
MLILAHVGYTVGVTLAADVKTQRRLTPDYRLMAIMSIAPDIIDRALFVFVLPSALSGRLIAHTILFQLVFFALIVLMRRRWWIYGAASAFHLLLDTSWNSSSWFVQVLWPLLDSQLSAVNIDPNSSNIAVPYYNWIFSRSQEALAPYLSAPLSAWILEMGGALVLATIIYCKSLYDRLRLWQFLVAGRL